MTNMEMLKEFMNINWLRPQFALFRAIECAVSYAFEFESPSLDLGCGDGLFSFIRAGGSFNSTFDTFLDNDYELFEHFDANSFKHAIRCEPEYMFDVALDLGSRRLNCAKSLGFYKDVVHHDANAKLPFEDGSFNSMYSNAIHHLAEPQVVLHEVARVLNTGGKACLRFLDRSLGESLIYNRLYASTKNEKWAWLKYLPRNKLIDMDITIDGVPAYAHMYSNQEMAEMFNDVGLKIVEHRKFLSKSLVGMWEIGTNPIFSALLKMQGKLSSEDRLEVKKEWIDRCMDFALPLMEIELSRNSDDCVFHNYVVCRK